MADLADRWILPPTSRRLFTGLPPLRGFACSSGIFATLPTRGGNLLWEIKGAGDGTTPIVLSSQVTLPPDVEVHAGSILPIISWREQRGAQATHCFAFLPKQARESQVVGPATVQGLYSRFARTGFTDPSIFMHTTHKILVVPENERSGGLVWNKAGTVYAFAVCSDDQTIVYSGTLREAGIPVHAARAVATLPGQASPLTVSPDGESILVWSQMALGILTRRGDYCPLSPSVARARVLGQQWDVTHGIVVLTDLFTGRPALWNWSDINQKPVQIAEDLPGDILATTFFKRGEVLAAVLSMNGWCELRIRTPNRPDRRVQIETTGATALEIAADNRHLVLNTGGPWDPGSVALVDSSTEKIQHFQLQFAQADRDALRAIRGPYPVRFNSDGETTERGLLYRSADGGTNPTVLWLTNWNARPEFQPGIQALLAAGINVYVPRLPPRHSESPVALANSDDAGELEDLTTTLDWLQQQNWVDRTRIVVLVGDETLDLALPWCARVAGIAALVGIIPGTTRELAERIASQQEPGLLPPTLFIIGSRSTGVGGGQDRVKLVRERGWSLIVNERARFTSTQTALRFNAEAFEYLIAFLRNISD